MTLANDGDAAGARATRPFTPEQISYLGSLPAVVGIGPNRIRYAKGFQRACLRRYMNGANPTDLFRKAGLDPEIIGHKRIERSFARWRVGLDDLLGPDSTANRSDPDDARFFINGDPSENPGGGIDRWRMFQAADDRDGYDERDGRDKQVDRDGHDATDESGRPRPIGAGVDESMRSDAVNDVTDKNPSPNSDRRPTWSKDTLIDQLIRYNAILERENRLLRRRLGLNTPDDDDSGGPAKSATNPRTTDDNRNQNQEIKEKTQP